MCQEPWAPVHKCTNGNAYFIEVFSDSELDEEVELANEGGQSSGGPPPPPPKGGSFAPTKEVLASLQGVSQYLTLRIKGTCRGNEC